jgi:hypothetical protein
VRFRLSARRTILVSALALGLALTAAACSSSSSSTPASTSSPSAPASSSAPSSPASSAAPSSPAAGGNAAAVAAITANWEKFFNSSTPASEKAKLLQNGTSFEAAIKAFATLPLASNIGAKVTKVTVTSPTSATVTYTITSGGSDLLSGQKGTSVNQGGTWKVGDASLCALFKMIPGGSVPAACNSVG